MEGRVYPMRGERPNLPFKETITPASIVSDRVEILSGGYTTNGSICVVSITFMALKDSVASPSIFVGLQAAAADSALSCIDITQGIVTAITSSVPCGISTTGTLYLQSIVTNHVYSVSGVYII